MTRRRLSEVWDEVAELALSLGALKVGASDLNDRGASLYEEWLDQGHHAQMRWLENNREARRDPMSRFPWGRSVIAVSVPYTPRKGTGELATRVARYAQGEDYHFVLDEILEQIESRIHSLHPESRTRRYTDTGPLSDRAYAAQAGLGWIGRNSMLIDEQNGSYLFLGVVITDLENDVDPPPAFDRCGTCTRCVDLCPTEAILDNRTVDSNRCISYLTIEHRGELPGGMEDQLHGWLFGCDICQEVCPWTARAPEGIPEFEPRESYESWSLVDLARMSQGEFSSLFRRSAIKRTKHAGLTRNARLLLAHPDPDKP